MSKLEIENFSFGPPLVFRLMMKNSRKLSYDKKLFKSTPFKNFSPALTP
jgi:hypothetical protein